MAIAYRGTVIAGRFHSLAARAVSGLWIAILSVALTSTAALARIATPADTIQTSPLKTRVWGFGDGGSGQPCVGGTVSHGIATGSDGFGYESASGRPIWPNRDPLGEDGFETLRHGRANVLGDGPSLYTFVQNNSADRTDSLGLAISTIDGSLEACMRLPTPAMQQECISDLLEALGVSKECCVLAAAVQVAKKAAGATGKCSSSDSCAVLRAKSATWLSLALARSRLHKKCFSGGDPGRQQALADVWKVLGDCTAYQVKNGCTGPL
jgi:hypothetical protein